MLEEDDTSVELSVDDEDNHEPDDVEVGSVEMSVDDEDNYVLNRECVAGVDEDHTLDEDEEDASDVNEDDHVLDEEGTASVDEDDSALDC